MLVKGATAEQVMSHNWTNNNLISVEHMQHVWVNIYAWKYKQLLLRKYIGKCNLQNGSYFIQIFMCYVEVALSGTDYINFLNQ